MSQVALSKLLRYVASELQPLTVVESPGFRQLVSTLDPRAPIPSRNYLRDNTMIEYYQETKSQVQELLGKVERHAITTDLWTSGANEDYLTITAHMISTNFDILSFVLQTRNVTCERHTAENLSIEFEKALVEWDLKNPIVVSDNARNITNVFSKFLKWDHIGCMAHTINLAVTKCFKLGSVSKLLAKCHHVVSHFRRSTLQTKVLKEKQKLLSLPNHSLILDCETRWNSTHDMLVRLLEQEPAICAALMTSGKRDERSLNLSDTEIQKMSSLIEILKPLKTATTFLGSEKSPTASRMLPLLLKLKKHLSPAESDSNFEAEVKQEMFKDLDNRYKSDSDKEFLIMACMLDPRCKELSFLSREEIDQVKVKLETVCLEISLQNTPVDPIPLVKTEPKDTDLTVSVKSEDGPTVPKKIRYDNAKENDPPKVSENQVASVKSIKTEYAASQDTCLEDFLSDIVITKVEGTPTLSDKVIHEVKSYISEPSIPLNACPLDWWRTMSQIYPNVSVLAKQILCVPATSVSSERVFSTAGFCSDKRRSNLAPENLDKLIFLNKNLKSLSEQKDN